VDQLRFEQYLERARRELAVTDYETAWHEGRQMEVADALEYAREILAAAFNAARSSFPMAGTLGDAFNESGRSRLRARGRLSLKPRGADGKSRILCNVYLVDSTGSSRGAHARPV
jgi:hypothetical protein